MKPRELQKQFEGRGEVAGYNFEQIQASKWAYIYRRTAADAPKSYEVFKRKISASFDGTQNVVLYPRSKAFGIWAWNFSDYEKAMEKFEQLNEAGKKAEKSQKQISV